MVKKNLIKKKQSEEEKKKKRANAAFPFITFIESILSGRTMCSYFSLFSTLFFGQREKCDEISMVSRVACTLSSI